MARYAANPEKHRKQVKQIRRKSFVDDPLLHRVTVALRLTVRKGLRFDVMLRKAIAAHESLWPTPDGSEQIGFDLLMTGAASPMSISLDRVDSAKGYTLDNVRWIPHWMNLCKSNATVAEMEKVWSAVSSMEQARADDALDWFLANIAAAYADTQGALDRLAHRKRMMTRARNTDKENGSIVAGRGHPLHWRNITIPDLCPVLGIKLKLDREGLDRHERHPLTPSLDRIDNRWPHLPGNVWVISVRANTLKRHWTAAQLKAVLDYMRKAGAP